MGWGKIKHRLDDRIRHPRARRRLETAGMDQEEIDARLAKSGPEQEDMLPAWRLHDLRRTVASGLARMGFEPHIVERVLNHGDHGRRTACTCLSAL